MRFSGALLGFIGTFIGIITPPILIWLLLTRKEWLIFGEKLLQEVVAKNGEEAIKCQIPYTNIESVSMQKEFDQDVVAIQLKDLEDRDTYCNDATAFTTRQKHGLMHYSINDSYQDTLDNLCRKLKKRIPAN